MSFKLVKHGNYDHYWWDLIETTNTKEETLARIFDPEFAKVLTEMGAKIWDKTIKDLSNGV